jgi:hypothetical protein
LKFLPKKLSLSSQKYGFGIRDPGSGIRQKPIRILDPGSRGQKGTGSRIRIRNGSVHNIFMFGPIEMVGLGLGWKSTDPSNSVHGLPSLSNCGHIGRHYIEWVRKDAKDPLLVFAPLEAKSWTNSVFPL